MESPKKQGGNFLDSLPLLRSEDSDQFIPRNPESKPKKKEKSNKDQKNPLKGRTESKDSFELLNQTTDSQIENNKPSIKAASDRKVCEMLEKSRKSKSEASEDNEKNCQPAGKSANIQRICSPLKFEYKMEDLNVFVITVHPPIESNENDAKDEVMETGKLCIEKDRLVECELKAYCPKIPQKKKPWTIFGAGIAAFIVFIIIIFKIRRGLKR